MLKIQFMVLTVFTWLLMLTSCASEPWKQFPISESPDISCQTGYEGGLDIWAWSCYKGEHIVIWRFSSIFYSGSVKRESVKCGEITEFEKSEDLKTWNYPKCRKSASAWSIW